MTDEVTYVITVDEGEWINKARYLYNSILQNVENPEIVAFVPEEADIPDSFLSELKENCEIVSEEHQIEGFHASGKLQAFKKAAEISERDYLLLLDTDLLVMDDIEIQSETDADVLMKPVDLGLQYWARDESWEEWKKIQEMTDYDIPPGKVRSTVDNKQILPYFNTGVVLCKNNDIPDKWFELTKKLHGEISNGFMTGQVAMAFIAQDYDLEILDEKYNYPLPHRLGCPPDVKIIHYHAYEFIPRIWRPELKEKIAETGIYERIREENRYSFYKRFCFEILKTFKGRIIGYG